LLRKWQTTLGDTFLPHTVESVAEAQRGGRPPLLTLKKPCYTKETALCRNHFDVIA